jgi:hypothetical protein
VIADWFYSVGDARQGPVTEADLQQLVAAGRLKPADLVWQDGMPDWVEARTVPALFPPRNAEPARVEDRPYRRRFDDDLDRPARRDDPDDRPARRRRDDFDPDDDRPRVAQDDHRDDYDDRPRRRRQEKPGNVQAVGIMMLCGGILALVVVLSYLAGTMCIVLVWPGWYFELVVGILMIIRGVNMMNQDDQGPPRTLAILQILFILNLDIINCVLGIVSLVMLNEPKVQDYYRRRGFA